MNRKDRIMTSQAANMPPSEPANYDGPRFAFDGWYPAEEDAKGVADWLVTLDGVLSAEVLTGAAGSHGVLYITTIEHFDNHVPTAWPDWGSQRRSTSVTR